jgi:hypothetical protein
MDSLPETDEKRIIGCHGYSTRCFTKKHLPHEKGLLRTDSTMSFRRCFFAVLALFPCALPLHAQNLETVILGPTIPAGSVSTNCTGTNERGGWMAGSSFYFLKPYAGNNVAFSTITGFGTNAPQTNSTDFNWGLKPALAIWLGYSTPDGFGVRARWFDFFDQSPNALTTSLTSPAAATTKIGASPNLPTFSGGFTFGSPGVLLASGLGTDKMTFSSSLQITTVDLEATYTWNAGPWAFLFGGGFRYLHMNQTYQATLSNNFNNGVAAASESQSLDSSHNFNGAGPVLDFQATWKICQTNLAVFVVGRTSLIAGQSSQSASLRQTVLDPTGLTSGGTPVDTTVAPAAHSSSFTAIPIVELEVGVEYGKQIGHSWFFVRGAGVNQTYFGAGNSSSTSGNLSLFGGQISLGVNY